MKNKLIFIVYLLFIIFGLFCIYNRNHDKDKYEYNDKDFSIIASSENEVFSEEFLDYMDKIHVKTHVTYADTLDIVDRLNHGEKYDAVWMSNSIWMYRLDSSKVSVTNSKSTSIIPIVFGIKKSKAQELGFTDKDVYMKDILNAIKDGKLKFSMSNPTKTNSGASAYLGILSTLAGNPEVLTSEYLEKEDLKTNLKAFFSGIERTSGNEDYLEVLFLNGDYDAALTYESSIININKKLIRDKKEPLYAIYPVDGVSISDSPIAYIDNKNSDKKEKFEKVQQFLLGDDGQKLLAKYGRRTWYGGTNNKVNKDVFNPDWGIDTTKYISPVKYPSTDVIKKALMLYQSELRKQAHIVFCLDYSGSMEGDGITELRNAMHYILGEEAANDLIQFSSQDKIDVLAFSSTVNTPWSTDNGEITDKILENIDKQSPYGSTAIYPAAIKAIKLLEEDKEDYLESVVLMTDGKGNVGSYYELNKLYKKYDSQIPIYSITFGNAEWDELEEIAELTNGKVFDGTYDLVEAFKEVRGYN